MVLRNRFPSGQQVDDRVSGQGQNMAKSENDAGTKALVPGLYEDKHGLPVIYAEAGQKKLAKAESNTISVLWHELISPLTLIKGYTATLLQLNSVITEDQKEQYLRGIDTASNRVMRLLENLRDITRLEETDVMSMVRISLPDVLRQVAVETQNQTTKHVIKILPGMRLPLVKADPERIELVIRNIITNAVKYSPQGGDIEIESRLVQNEQELRRLFGDAPEVKVPCLIVSIADSGVGVPAAELEQIFEKFYRVKSKFTQSTPGAGLGLYICKIIIGAHGGHIWARNRHAGGSVFNFSLPLQ